MTACSATGYFNPRSRMGSDLKGPDHWQWHWQFQSTLPHGERLELSGPSALCRAVFQSTLPHGERRVGRACACGEPRISIHAPAWGATDADLVFDVLVLFQSTLPHGERPRWRR